MKKILLLYYFSPRQRLTSTEHCTQYGNQLYLLKRSTKRTKKIRAHFFKKIQDCGGFFDRKRFALLL